MAHYILPANQTDGDMWEVRLPEELKYRPCVIYPCIHLDHNGITRSRIEGTLCPVCEAICHDGRWKLVVPPLLTDRIIKCFSNVRIVPEEAS
jgi:hypothetical protein